MWVCRSCTCLYASAGLTSVALWCWPELRAHAALCLAGVGIVTLAGSHPRLYKRLPRPMRDLLRAGMGSCFALIVAAGVQESWWAAAVTAVILFLFWRYYFALRRVRRARACDSCPDYSESEICPGCQDQVQAANRYEELASEYRMRRYVP